MNLCDVFGEKRERIEVKLGSLHNHALVNNN